MIKMKRLLVVAGPALQKFVHLLITLSILTVGLFPATTSAQLPDHPPEFSPLSTSRPAKPQPSRVPSTKFVKVKDSIPNRYIVVLNDDVVDKDAPLKVRRERIEEIAKSDARAHFGTVGFVYATALKGYSIELPNEEAAIAISKNAHVKWIEEEGQLHPQQDEPRPNLIQTQPPWGLDAIDGSIPIGPVLANGTTNGLYIHNATGAGVRAYVLDSGVNRVHQEFGLPPFIPRASIGADFIAAAQLPGLCTGTLPNSTNNDCDGHGTFVAGILGGTTTGVAKQVSIVSVKVCTVNICPTSLVINGIDWVTNQRQLNPSVPAVANMSLGFSSPSLEASAVNAAVSNSINFGITYVASAGNGNTNAQFIAPANLPEVLTVGAVDAALRRWALSNWGSSVDLFAPGFFVRSAFSGNLFVPGCLWSGGNADYCTREGTSFAAPHVAGAVAMYLQNRPSTTSCAAFPKQGRASPPIGGSLSTCPDRVTQYIKANANLNRLTDVNITIGFDPLGNPIIVRSPNRFLHTVSIPAPVNPIDNQRFYVWQQYADFLAGQPEPDENGLNFWTGTITGTCGTGFNDNNSCTNTKRIDVSRAFWVAAHGSLFNSQGTTNNSQFVSLCYDLYLRRRASDDIPGFQFWLSELNSFGNPANYAGVNHLIDAFINSGEYRRRFGQ